MPSGSTHPVASSGTLGAGPAGLRKDSAGLEETKTVKGRSTGVLRKCPRVKGSLLNYTDNSGGGEMTEIV